MQHRDDHFRRSTAADLSDAAGWLAVASGLAQLRLSNGPGPADAPALRLDYDFAGGGGFVVARREVVFDLPEAWEVRLFVRGEAPANTLELKLVDTAGSSVWRWKREAFQAWREWTELCIASHDFEFAWGPAGGGSIRRTSALEIAVVATPGGSGFLEMADVRILDRSPNHAIALAASSSAPGTSIVHAIDQDSTTRWRSIPGSGPHALTMDFGEKRVLGGLVVRWDEAALPRTFRVEVSSEGDGDAWTVVHDAPLAGVPFNFVSLPAVSMRRLKVTAESLCDADGVGIVSIEVKPVEWSRTASEFLTNVAHASRRGTWPRYLRREQSYWTPLATPVGGPVGLLSSDGAVEVGEGGFLLEPSLLHLPLDPAASTGAHGAASTGAIGAASTGATGAASTGATGAASTGAIGAASTGATGAARWITWADVTHSLHLEAPPLPVPTVVWHDDEVTLEVTAVAGDGGDTDTDLLFVRYRVTNAAAVTCRVTLCVALRPLQVTPPWQAYRHLGGPSPIRSLQWCDDVVTVNGSARVSPAPRFGAAAFDEGGVAASLAAGRLPSRTSIEDAAGHAEGVVCFDLVLAAGASEDVLLECRFPRQRTLLPSRTAMPATVPRLVSAIDDWRRALPLPTLSGCEEATKAHDAATTAVAHILACRDGAALQPGPRRYTRSWIRDGAIMAAALTRSGRADAAREFIEWYAPFQRDDGFVPCCVDRDGVDPLVEHDSHGQLVHAVAETFRFTRDLGFVRSLWPHCVKAVEFVEALRATRKTDAFRNGSHRACFGLLPESVSHEGYLSQPVHSYWDDFWALRGLRDAAFLARELALEAGEPTPNRRELAPDTNALAPDPSALLPDPGALLLDAHELGLDATRWDAAAADLGAAITASMLVVMEERGLATVPASVEWADFDPTSIAGAISLVGALEQLPAAANENAFDEYLKGFRAKRDGKVAWNNYTAYEVRIIGALVRMGRRDDANELLDFLLADRRPVAWGQWPEITWRDATAPAHLGDLPHCWIGAEYVIALRSMFVFERESDAALVIGAGLRREWLDAEGGIAMTNVPTWYGDLDLSIRPGGEGKYEVVVGGSARPPGGFVVELPGQGWTIEAKD